MPGKVKDITGKRFGKLVAAFPIGLTNGKGMKWHCSCDCGNELSAYTRDLQSENTKSCGCYKKEISGKASISHGATIGGKPTGTLVSYRTMKQRCYDKNFIEFPRYGARGIAVCDRWLGDAGFINFRNDLGERPNGYSIERINVELGYSPENCKWIPKGDQAKNTRKTVRIIVDGVEMCESDVARHFGVGRWKLSTNRSLTSMTT